MGYENELMKHNQNNVSEFSSGCMERYFELMEEIKGQ